MDGKGVTPVIEELAEGGRCLCATSLLAIKSVHVEVEEDCDGRHQVDPCWARVFEIWEISGCDCVGGYEGKHAGEGDEVGGQPVGEPVLRHVCGRGRGKMSEGG